MTETVHKRRIALLGSTGSMGKQSLEVIAQFPELLKVEVLAANTNAALLIQQARTFKPNRVVVVQNDAYLTVKEALRHENIKVFGGEQSLYEVCSLESVDMVLTCLVGIAGLYPVYYALDNGKKVALANKEALAVAGELMIRKAHERHACIYPIDSEHSAIFQCLMGEAGNTIEKLILTASGGPFRGWPHEALQTVTKAQALNHPNWKMGPKVTIDSATLMNKGLEVIEAKWLFGVPLDNIEVLVHPQSIIHSLVQFQDGSIKAQLGVPDMRLPIQYSLTYPQRWENAFPRLNFADYSQLTFEKPDRATFPCIDIAYQASHDGGNMPCVMNAANEIAVQWFLEDRIAFTDIPRLIEKALSRASFCTPENVEEYLAIDRDTKDWLIAEKG